EARAWLGTLPLKRDRPVAGGDGVFRRDQYGRVARAVCGFCEFKTKIAALAAWLRQGELEGCQIRCAPWHPETFRRVLVDVRGLTRLKEPAFLARLRTACAKAGVAVVFVRAPSGCRASGATRFIAPDKAMIILSFRHLSDDHFW